MAYDKTLDTPSIPKWVGQSRIDLLRLSLGGWEQILDNIRQAAHILVSLFNPFRIRKRLIRLQQFGHLEALPGICQMLIAGRDQILISAVDETKTFYQKQGIPWVFHNFRRFVACPASMMDPIGLLSHRDTVIHHIFQTYHRHPLYDFVLLRAHDQGLEEMGRQLELFHQRKHPKQEYLETLIEDGHYHEKIYWQFLEFMKDPLVKSNPIPEGLSPNPYLMLAMDQFKDIRGFTNYASRLKVGLWDVIRAVFQILVASQPKQIQIECCDREFVKRYFPGRKK